MKIIKLEAIRGFVALYVVIHHFILFTPIYSLTPSIIKLLFRFGREAVLVFFLLSGFVICIAIKKKAQTGFYDYFKKRFLRIYPILLTTFLISILIFYSNGYTFSVNTFRSMANNFMQLQRVDNEPGTKIPPFLGNLPLWSLSYEWWFYMLFFPLHLLFGKFGKKLIIKDIYFILILSVVSWFLFRSYPSHSLLILSFFLLWWTGFYCAEVYYSKRTFEFKDIKHAMICLLIMSAAIGIPVIKSVVIEHKGIAEINRQYPLTNYLYNYIEAFLLIAAGLIWWKIKLFKFDLIFGWFAKLAPISYALYIIHFPVILLKIPFITNLYLLLAVKLALIFLLSYFLELIFQTWVMKKYRQIGKISKKDLVIIPETV